MTKAPLTDLALTYDVVGDTRPDLHRWPEPAGYRRYERTVRLGAGDACWGAASAAVRSWAVKTGSGFTVDPGVPADGDLRRGDRHWLVAQLGPLRVREPVEVVAVVADGDRSGFAYGTLAGHPISGEEAFVVQRVADGSVFFILRSLTRPARGWRRALFPVAVLAQPWYRHRYVRAARTLTRRPAR